MRNKREISLFAIAFIAIFSISMIITGYMQNISAINDGNSHNDSDEQASPIISDQASLNIDDQASQDQLTLLCIDGIGGNPRVFDPYFSNVLDLNSNNISDFIDYYGEDNIFAVDHYQKGPGDYLEPEFEGASSLEEKALGFFNYIVNGHQSGKIHDNIDIVAHSMGGVFVRYMVKHYYYDLIAEGVIIKHLALPGAPNHGTWASNLAVLAIGALGCIGTALAAILGLFIEQVEQGLQMSCLSPFILALNSEDETPYDISYNTYRGKMGLDIYFAIASALVVTCSWTHDWSLPMFCYMVGKIGIEFDGLVSTNSVPLEGALNNRLYDGVDHGGLLSTPVVLQDVLDDMKA